MTEVQYKVTASCLYGFEKGTTVSEEELNMGADLIAIHVKSGILEPVKTAKRKTSKEV